MKVIIPALPISNLGAVANMVKKCGGNPLITSDPRELYNADRIIISGVGSFDSGIISLKEGGWLEALTEIHNDQQIPILGICLGMQLMCINSDEGFLNGLSWFNANVKLIQSADKGFKVPHMGWNTVEVVKNDTLLDNFTTSSRFYFVHSFHVVCNDSTDVVAITNYHLNITAIIRKGLTYGVQFHPEKSHNYGVKLISNFLNLKKYD